MNLGGRVAHGEYLCFLHADSQPGCSAQQLAAISKKPLTGVFAAYVSLAAKPVFRLIEYCMNLRSRVTRIGTGDQMLFLRREIFRQTGGFDDIPLMEDVAYCKRLRRTASPLLVTEPVRYFQSPLGGAGDVLHDNEDVDPCGWPISSVFLPGGCGVITMPVEPGSVLFIQFARSPVAGEVKTRMIPALGARRACQLHCDLVRWTSRILVNAGLGPVRARRCRRYIAPSVSAVPRHGHR